MKQFFPIFFLFSFLSAEIYDVSIPENDTASYNYADFRMWVNDSTDTLRGIYWFMHPNNGDSRNIVSDSAYQALADSQDFALMGAHIFNMHMNTGIGDAVIAAMDSFAVKFRHDEISFIPFFINGYSWGGQFAYHFSKWIPERIVGVITQKGGYHNEDSAGDAVDIPMLMFVGEDDLPYRIENLTGIFLDHRPLGAKWALAMEQGAGHSQVNDHLLLDSFFHTVTNLRLPDSMDVFAPITLNTLQDSTAWFGDQDNWTIGSFDCYDGVVDSSSWFPSRNVGELWQNFVSEGVVTDTSDCEELYITQNKFQANQFNLQFPYPNPFNPTTTIRFTVASQHIYLPNGVTTSLRIYDITGRLVETLVDGKMNPGEHEVIWDASEFASGVYYAVLNNGQSKQFQKVTLLK